jgi:hypothetical protein
VSSHPECLLRWCPVSEGRRQLARSATDDSASALYQLHVAPATPTLANALADPDDAEAAPLVKGDAARVLREDAALDRPDPSTFSRIDERSKQLGTDSAALKSGVHIHAVLDDPAIHAS